MLFTRRSRYIFWIIKDLALKYTRSLFLGFLIGFIVSLALLRFFPIISQAFIVKRSYVGIIGEYNVSSLPLSVQNQLSIGLTALKEDGSVGPALATWYEASESGKLFIFHLDTEAKWHTGKPVQSFDINYNIRGVTFKVRDMHTIEARLEFPFSPFPVLMSKPLFQQGLVGAGLYRVSRIKLKGDSIQMLEIVPVQNKSNSAIVYRFYKTENLAITAYQLGEIDTILDLSNNPLSSWKDTHVTKRPKYDRIVSLFFNMKNAFLSEKAVRQALGYAVPDNLGTKAYVPFAKTSWAYTDQVRQYTYDPKQTKKLLDSIDISSQSAELTISTFPAYLDIATKIADSWTKIGIPTRIQVENTLPETYQILLSAIDIPPDPDQYIFWHSTQTTTNITGYANPKIDKLLEDGRQEMDPEKRKKIYADFARRLVDDSPALFLLYPNIYTIQRNPE